MPVDHLRCLGEGLAQRGFLTLRFDYRGVGRSQGPALEAAGVVDMKRLPPEHREAADENWDNDLHGAIDWYSHVTMLVCDGEYDEHFEPHHEAIVTVREGEKTILPGKGVRTSGGS